MTMCTIELRFGSDRLTANVYASFKKIAQFFKHYSMFSGLDFFPSTVSVFKFHQVGEYVNLFVAKLRSVALNVQTAIGIGLAVRYLS